MHVRAASGAAMRRKSGGSVGMKTEGNKISLVIPHGSYISIMKYLHRINMQFLYGASNVLVVHTVVPWYLYFFFY